MAGIASYGAYVPLYRLSRETIARAWGSRAFPGEKAIANFDEDVITMAVAAGLDCLIGFDPKQVDGLFLATTTSPYREKQAASLVASALDLPREARTADFTDTLRAGTIALLSAIDAVKSGSARSVLVIASDARLGAPQGDFEQLLGDSAAAILVGDSEAVASFEGSYSIFNEFTDVWRTSEDVFVRSWEDRFISEEGYVSTVREAVLGLFQKYHLTPKSFAKVALYAHDHRSHPGLARALGFDLATQVQDPLLTSVGHSGAASVLMMLAAALETSKAGDKILAAGYGDGSDALIFQVTENLGKLAQRRGVTGHVNSKRLVGSYQRYILWRQLIATEPPKRPQIPTPSLPAIWRQHDRIFPFYGVKCRQCGTIQYPPPRVCLSCKAKDSFEKFRLSNQKGQVFTFTKDNLYASIDPPTIFGCVDFEVGGRFMCEITDRDAADLQIGTPVELTFRKLFTTAGFHNYFWKARPIR